MSLDNSSHSTDRPAETTRQPATDNTPPRESERDDGGRSRAEARAARTAELERRKTEAGTDKTNGSKQEAPQNRDPDSSQRSTSEDRESRGPRDKAEAPAESRDASARRGTNDEVSGQDNDKQDIAGRTDNASSADQPRREHADDGDAGGSTRTDTETKQGTASDEQRSAGDGQAGARDNSADADAAHRPSRERDGAARDQRPDARQPDDRAEQTGEPPGADAQHVASRGNLGETAQDPPRHKNDGPDDGTGQPLEIERQPPVTGEARIAEDRTPPGDMEPRTEINEDERPETGTRPPEQARETTPPERTGDDSATGTAETDKEGALAEAADRSQSQEKPTNSAATADSGSENEPQNDRGSQRIAVPADGRPLWQHIDPDRIPPDQRSHDNDRERSTLSDGKDDDPNTADRLPTGDKLASMESDKLSRRDRMRREAFSMSGDLISGAKKQGNFAQDALRPPPSGHPETRVSAPDFGTPDLKGAPHQGLDAGNALTATLATGMLLGEGYRRGRNRLAGLRRRDTDAGH